jgi:hypothetical protein
MKDYPIIFSAPMVRALLDGSKTQTRRVVKPRLWAWNEGRTWPKDSRDFSKLQASPYGQPGDRLWVRETWAQPTNLDPGPIFYRADYPACVPARFENVLPADAITWKPSIHMFRVVGRVTPFTEAEQMQINLPVRVAFESIRTSRGEESDFHTLAAAVNITMVCAERIDPLVEQSCTAARDALQRMYDRHARVGSWGFDGPALQEVEQGVEIYEQLTALLTGGQLKAAMTECYRRMREGEVIEPVHGNASHVVVEALPS